MWKTIILILFIPWGLFSMNIGIEFDFPRGLEFYSLEAFTYNGNYYDPRIIEMSPLQLSISDDHGFQVPNMTVVLKDEDGHFAAMLTDPYNKYFLGRDTILRQQSGSQIRLFYIENGYPGKDGAGTKIFTFIFSDLVSELNNNIIEVIDENYFPDAETNTVYGHAIPRIYRNNENLTDISMIRCYHVNKTHGTTDYLASSKEINNLTYVEDSDGANRTGIASIQIEDGLYYIKLANPIDGEYVLVNAQPTTIDTPYEVIVDLMGRYFKNFGGETFSDSALESWLLKNDYRQYFAIGEQMTGKELLKMICDSFQLDWYIDSDRSINFTWIDPSALTPAKTYQGAEIADFNIDRVDTELLANRFKVNFGYNNQVGDFEQSHVFDFNSNQDKYGIYEKTIDLRFADTHGISTYNRLIEPWKTVLKHFWESKYPKIIALIEIRDDLIIDYYPGNLISFPHIDGLTMDTRLYIIRAINFDFINNKGFVTVWDYEFLNDFRTNDKFLLHSDTDDGSDIFLDASVGGFNKIFKALYQSGDDVHHSIDQSVFSNSSLKFVQNGKLLAEKSYTEEALFDMAAVTNFTADLWVYPNNFDSSYGLLAGYASEFEYWEIFIDTNGYLNFIYYNYSEIISITSTTALSSGEWNHIALCKVNSGIGLYADGTQVLFTNTSISPFGNDCSNISITGQPTGTGRTIDGYMDEIHVSHDNWFQAAPVVGLTDVIIPMNVPYTDESVNMEGDNARLLENYYPRLLETGEERLLE
jgi:hypothetical protein